MIAVVSLLSVVPTVVALTSVVTLVGASGSPLTPGLLALVGSGVVIGAFAPLVAESMVDSPVNPDGTKRNDFAEVILGAAIAFLPLLTDLTAPKAAPAVAVVLAVAVAATALHATGKGILTCRSYSA